LPDRIFGLVNKDGRMDYPHFVNELSKRPGTDWAADDVQHVKDWWSKHSQLKLVWYTAARYLGTGATQQDIEDAVVEFYVLFDRARISFKPVGPHFCDYLLHVCFKHHCLREGAKIRKRLNEETSLECNVQSGVLLLELPDTHAESDPYRRTRDMEFIRTLETLLNGTYLPEKQRIAFILRYFDNMSYEEIAVQMDAPLGSIKGWLNRSTATARAYMAERGWAECHIAA
jgi:RNA polymerase sigma factor (sigma-70 family)